MSEPTPQRAAPARLGIVISMFPELHETFILRELVALERHGVDFEVFSLQYPRDPITLEDARRLSRERTSYSPLLSRAILAAFARALRRRPVRTLGAAVAVLRHGWRRPLDALKNLAVLPIALRIGELGRARGIGHWHGHWANVPTTVCWYLGRVHGASWSAAIHGEDVFSPNPFLATKLDAAAFTVVCSGHFCRHLRTALGLATPERVHLNYHGLEPRVLERARTRPARREEGPLRLLAIGRLVPTKGHDTLVRALARLRAEGRDVVLEIVGAGALERTLREQAREAGVADALTLAGALGFDEVLERIERADLFCLAPRLLPGHPPDGIPNVIAEAMALGVPVVATRVSAVPELVEDGTSGRLVEVDDDAALAAAIATLADDPAAAARLAANARERVARLFDQDRNIAELIALFECYVPLPRTSLAPPARASARTGRPG